ncbi:MAG: hypothetical protein WBE26_09225 [Phycisphaerae bacterium]
MKTQEQVQTTTSRRTDVRPHRLGMGWHFVWRYDPPIVHHVQRDDGTSHDWEEEGETSEGCIMWLADEFARQELAGITAREIYRTAYKERDGSDFDDEWLATDSLRDAWAKYTVLPRQWTATQVRKLFEDLEDVNYHSFLAKLIELAKERAPELAIALADWCQEVAR